MIPYLLLTMALADHEADLELQTQMPLSEVRSCILDYYHRPLVSANATDRENGTSIAIGMTKIVNKPKPYWVVDVHDAGQFRALRVGFNYTNNPSSAEKTLRKVAKRCAPDATESTKS